MTFSEFSRAQEQGAEMALTALLHECQQRYLLAARLLGVLHDPKLAGLRTALRERTLSLSPLIPAWHVLCSNYRESRFDPQTSLFIEHDQEVLSTWTRYVYQEVFPALVESDEFVRNLLRALGVIPCPSPAKAIAAVVSQIETIDFPYPVIDWDQH